MNNVTYTVLCLATINYIMNFSNHLYLHGSYFSYFIIDSAKDGLVSPCITP